MKKVHNAATIKCDCIMNCSQSVHNAGQYKYDCIVNKVDNASSLHYANMNKLCLQI